MKKAAKSTMLIIVLILLFTVIYNLYDNNRIKVVTQEIKIDTLPNSFDGFTILQITDLHGRSFGENQERLIEKINHIDYDMIAITGDIQNRHSNNIDPFLKMVKGIENKKNVFFVYGNIDEPKYNEAIKSSGCIILDKPYKFVRGKDTLWVNQFVFTESFNEKGVKIGLTHIPIRSDMGYDLVICGHYHGGQYRIPFYGALFIPNIDGQQFLPKQSEVSGVQDYGTYKQYISRGLGASSSIKAFEFRLFNTPEMNVIKLVNK